MTLFSQLFIVTSFILSTSFSPAISRWATKEEAPIEYLFFKKEVNYKKNGHSSVKNKFKIKILNELGREQFGTLTFYYTHGLDNFKTPKVTVINNEKEIIITPDKIEDKPLASDVSGFDEVHQVLISLPNISIGSQIQVEYEVTRTNQPIDHYFSDTTFVEDTGIIQTGEIIYTSEVPMQLLINDPYHHLQSETSEENKLVKITLLNPIYERLVDEPGSSLSSDQQTWVAITTTKKQEELAKLIISQFEETINKPLPLLFKTIADKAKTQPTFIDQANYLTSSLAEKIRYMSDFRSHKGRFYPRSLDKIAQNALGDCKEYSVALVAMLRYLGYQAHVALVKRNINFYPPKKMLPPLEANNHAIVYAQDKDGKEYWLDPTNIVSMADGIFPDIANRPAVILAKNNPQVKNIPAINVNHAKTILEKTITFKADKTLVHKGKLQLFGENALIITGKALFESPQMIEDSIINILSDNFMPEVRQVKLPDLTSRIVKDVAFEFLYENKNTLIQTNYGQGVALRSDLLQRYLYTTPDPIGIKFIDGYFTIIKIINIEGVNASNIEKLNASINTPWVKASRTCYETETGIQVKTEISLCKNHITSEELKSKEYQKLKEDIQTNFNEVTAIISLK